NSHRTLPVVGRTGTRNKPEKLWLTPKDTQTLQRADWNGCLAEYRHSRTPTHPQESAIDRRGLAPVLPLSASPPHVRLPRSRLKFKQYCQHRDVRAAIRRL